jgi:hypothetical protein
MQSAEVGRGVELVVKQEYPRLRRGIWGDEVTLGRGHYSARG